MQQSAEITFLTESIDPLLAYIESENVSVMDQSRTGAATAIAAHVLEIIIREISGLQE